ncbi:alpha/beta hydrolase [Nanchangia anserum]|uniref:Alpha/beta hydrolase n=1 Tax=Nanchangia anserum TaxID=2692125 RepID=A0A8I0GDA0_9ACTO|nr:alpha/beta hydrolase [Nanchangia anserum]MBD3689433.1 alpha/beta hydrolase [Nanchangia anserum]QOX81637.1 alpha/beta hydrolase [Nanchangia anserum]
MSRPRVVAIGGLAVRGGAWSDVCARARAAGWGEVEVCDLADLVGRDVDVEAIAGEVAQRLDPAHPAVLVGHSLGGLVAEACARHYPERVAGLVLADATIASATEPALPRPLRVLAHTRAAEIAWRLVEAGALLYGQDTITRREEWDRYVRRERARADLRITVACHRWAHAVAAMRRAATPPPDGPTDAGSPTLACPTHVIVAEAGGRPGRWSAQQHRGLIELRRSSTAPVTGERHFRTPHLLMRKSPEIIVAALARVTGTR